MIRQAAVARLFTLGLWVALLGGCVSEQVIRANAPPAASAGQPVAEQQLLNVGIVLFDPGLPKDGKVDEKSGIYPQVRKAEARYLPYILRQTLEDTGQWGAVRLVPDDTHIADVLVTGRIVQSDGSELTLDVEVRDATGNSWLSKRYTATASKYAYSDEHFSEQDPFQTVYNSIANDMLAARKQLTDKARTGTRTVAELRLAQELSPEAFDGYLREDPPGHYSVVRLPADGDPMLRRVRSVRARDAMLLDTLDGHYANFYQDMKPAYRDWRGISFEESVELKKLQRSARNRMGMGAAAVVAGVAGGFRSDSTAGQVVSTATAVGGAGVFASGMKKYSQSQIHVEALRELNVSFAADVKPKVVELEGETLTLTGSAEAQYETWRRLLRDIYAEETGLPPLNPSAD